METAKMASRPNDDQSMYVKRAGEISCIRAYDGDPDYRVRSLIPRRLVHLAICVSAHAQRQSCEFMFHPRDGGKRGRLHSLGMGTAASGDQAAHGQRRLNHQNGRAPRRRETHPGMDARHVPALQQPAGFT